MTSSDQEIAAVFTTHGQATSGMSPEVVNLSHPCQWTLLVIGCGHG